MKTIPAIRRALVVVCAAVLGLLAGCSGSGSADAILTLGANGSSAQSAPLATSDASNQQEISRLYVALFGRAPDSEGLSYWTSRLAAGESSAQLADAMYAVAPARAYYPLGLGPGDIVAAFYLNVLGRQADDSGLTYWTGKITQAGATPGSVIAEMISVVANYSGTVPEGLKSARLFNNRVTVALYYGQNIGTLGTSATQAIASVTDDYATVTSAIAALNSPGASAFKLTSSVATEGGALPADHTCDGNGGSPPLSWTGAPAATKAFALLVTTIPADGSVKYNWVLYNVSALRQSLPLASFGLGESGVGSDGPAPAYQPPCSQGPGAKTYTFALHALSSALSFQGVPDGATVAAQVALRSLARATLNVTYSRSASASGSATACTLVRQSLQGGAGTTAQVGCDAQYAYVSSDGLASHAMMDGITATNLQVPTAQRFLGSNAWRIPLAPRIADTPTPVVDGPVGIAVNGVPIFNPCKQGGCQNGDTKVLGELDICNGHAGRADDYHYHAAPVCLMATKSASYWDTHPLGWALDGFGIYGYNDSDGKTAVRDGVCGGNALPVTNGPQGYKYHVTDASPYVMSCLRGVPSPDLAGQSAKYSPMRQPPVTPFAVSGMTLRSDTSTGQQVLRFSSARTFVTTSNGQDSYNNLPGSYQIRYRQLKGDTLEAALALPANRNRSACWEFDFRTEAGASSQPLVTYCR